MKFNITKRIIELNISLPYNYLKYFNQYNY